MDSRLQNKVAVVTGGAKGIGLATAQRFSEEKAMVCIADIDDSAGKKVAVDLDGLFVHCDVSNQNQVQFLYKRVEEHYGGIDVLFNNAGISPQEDTYITDTSLKTWDHVMKINATSVFLCCKYGIPYLIKRGGGVIINTASFVALMGAATSQISYTASKGAVVAMSRELGIQFAKDHIRVNALCPGPVNTSLLKKLYANNPEEANKRLNHIPSGRFAEPEEIAAAAAFLASDDASYINATPFLVDGGLTQAYLTA